MTAQPRTMRGRSLPAALLGALAVLAALFVVPGGQAAVAPSPSLGPAATVRGTAPWVPGCARTATRPGSFPGAARAPRAPAAVGARRPSRRRARTGAGRRAGGRRRAGGTRRRRGSPAEGRTGQAQPPYAGNAPRPRTSRARARLTRAPTTLRSREPDRSSRLGRCAHRTSRPTAVRLVGAVIPPEAPVSRAPLVRALIALGDRRGLAVRRRHHTRPARARPARRHPDRPRDPGLADREGGRRVHRPGARGAAPPGRRARRRRADPHPVRRPADHRRAARRAGPARGGRGHRPDRAADLPPGARRRAAPDAVRPASPSPSPSGRRRRASWCCPTRAARTCGSAARPLTGEGVDGAQAELDPQGLGGWFVTIDFKGSGGAAWEELTGAAACAAAGRPDAPGRDRARRPGHLLAAGRPVGAVRRRHPRRLDPDHRRLHPGGGQGPGRPDPGRRAARAGRGHRAADRRPHPRCGRHRGQRQGRGHRRRADRAVHHRRLPAARCPGGGRARPATP